MIHYDLQLRRGGFLVALEPAEDGSLVEAVVDLSQTPQALHQTMCVAPGATLGDVLRLVRDHKEMFSRLADAPCLDEFLADAFEREEEEELHDLEAVELGWASVVDIEDGTSVFVMETDMHGRDVLGAACGLEMTPLCQLVDVPFEIRDSLSVLDGRDPQQVLLSCNSPMTVLQVVRGVLEDSPASKKRCRRSTPPLYAAARAALPATASGARSRSSARRPRPRSRPGSRP